MLDLQNQSKLVEAISFFAGNTKHCGFVKLFKLLYWLDYHHFRETGETVTGLSYQAFPYGPVPGTLYEELKSGHGAIADHFDITRNNSVATPPPPQRTIDDDDESYAGKIGSHKITHLPSRLAPHIPYKHRFLTRREQRIADRLAEVFRDVTAEQISDISHDVKGPWKQALKDRGERATIDFLGKLFPMNRGNYLDESELKRRVQEFEADVKNWA